MFCGKCGSMVTDGQAFCNICGAPLGNQQAQPNNQPNYQQPPVQPNYQQPNYQQPPVQQPVYNQSPLNATKPMGWFNFLIYFALWACAVLNIVAAINIFSGMQYEMELGILKLDAGDFYEFWPDLEGLDVFYGISCIAAAVFAVITRFALSSYRANAPKILIGYYVFVAIVELIYVISFTSIVGDGNAYIVFDTDEIVSRGIGSFIGGIIMVAINTIYFNKRKEMFKN